MAEGILIAALVAGSLALGIVSWLARLIAGLAGLPFGALHWFLHGLGFLVILPFVLALLVLTNGLAPATWWAGGGILAAALIAFIGGGFQLVRDLAIGRRAFARR